MAENRQLTNAKSAKNDEFYTQYADIQKEVNAYLDFNPDTFRGKTVLLPCDDPEWSKFTRFFAENFERLGLKKLISTSYAAASKKIGTGAKKWGDWYQPSLFESESPQFDAEKTGVRGKIFVLDHDTNANGRIDLDDLEWHYLEGDGDFRSEEVCRLRDEADVIVTNPPFSLFREFLAWILGECKSKCKIENGKCKIEAATKNTKDTKKFLILGNKNAVSYTEVFPLIKGNLMWSGVTEWAGGMWFETMDSTDVDKVVDGKNMKNVASVWFTNLEHGRRHSPLELMTMADNIKYSRHKEIRGKGYFTFENYPAIEVPYTDAIPADYEGIMAVPRSFIDKYCPEQFEIVGIAEGESGKELGLKAVPKELKKLNRSLRDGQLYYMKDGYPEKPFARILIRARRGK
ncbi:MAG: DNA methyltransferase [Kiritimatiellae bacterium]|nr:DNA methyltransferase [Kiritimatiellia bacterium]